MKKNISWWFLIIAVSTVITYLIPRNINVSINETLDRKQAEAIGKFFIISKGYSLDDYRAIVSRDAANFLIVYLNSRLEPDRFNKLVNSDTIPNIRWQVRYLKNIPKDQPQTNYYVWISPRGKIVGYRRDLPDTLTIESLSENEAADKARSFLTDRAKISMDEDGFIKIICDKNTDEILGVHMIGPRCADLISEAVVAMEYKASAEDIARICHAHPTFSEVMKEAALAATENRALHI